MSVAEKQAWFILIVFAVTMALFGGSILIFGWHEGLLGILGLYGLTGGVVLIGRSEKKSGKIIWDERDVAIERTANLIGYSIFWVILVIATMMPFFIHGAEHIVSIRAGSLSSQLDTGFIHILHRNVEVVRLDKDTVHCQGVRRQSNASRSNVLSLNLEHSVRSIKIIARPAHQAALVQFRTDGPVEQNDFIAFQEF